MGESGNEASGRLWAQKRACQRLVSAGQRQACGVDSDCGKISECVAAETARTGLPGKACNRKRDVTAAMPKQSSTGKKLSNKSGSTGAAHE